MIQAIFLDFYGTVAHEDDAVILDLSRQIQQAGNGASDTEIRRYWYETFHSLCRAAFGATFQTQRVIELQTLDATVRQFGAALDPAALCQPLFAQWVQPLLFEDSAAFFAHCPVPIFIVSNIDQDDVQQAVAYHKLKPAAIFTSEQARSYKPRAELFRLAMHTTGLKAENLLHVGDSYQNDVVGARAAGLSAVWLNRTGKTAPDDTVRTVKTLTELLPLLDGKEV